MAKKFIRIALDEILTTVRDLQTRLEHVESLLAKNKAPAVTATPKAAVSKPPKAGTKTKPQTTNPVATPQAPKPKAKPKTKSAASPAKAKTTPTLADAIKYVMTEFQKTKSGPTRVGQLYDAVQQAGYKFSSASRDNNLNYMSKVLRENNVFKRVDLGLYALA